ncbi:TORC N domain containing protein [Trichuris trichiura]|uniref:TORC N domain containing protein n=1 Tax=Trichuris trichiura TaxID=36087 RepID=A0A077Z656_TRITR|nr:TORC N domain containing protein [Trichuris trichiura]
MSSGMPRKFSEKIAIQQRKLNEDQSAFDQIMAEVHSITRVRYGSVLSCQAKHLQVVSGKRRIIGQFSLDGSFSVTPVLKHKYAIFWLVDCQMVDFGFTFWKWWRHVKFSFLIRSWRCYNLIFLVYQNLFSLKLLFPKQSYFPAGLLNCKPTEKH